MPNKHKVGLFIIDPQNDFVSKKLNCLYVPNGEDHMDNVARMIQKFKNKIDEIHITQDSHHIVDISHIVWWTNPITGKHPEPFTQISYNDMKEGKWTTTEPGCFARTLSYLEALEKQGKFKHTIWINHCIIGSEGHTIYKPLQEEINEWEFKNFKMANITTKGSNPWTEHYSAIKAEVVDPTDLSTDANMNLIHSLERLGLILVSGEALSHCLATTCRDLLDLCTDKRLAEKMVLLTDATGNVSGFENQGENFIKEMIGRGMRLSTTKEIFN